MKQTKKIEYTPLVLGILFIIISIYFLISGIKQQEEYNTIKDNLITVPATVFEITKEKDIDDNTEYRVKVIYTYNSEQYKDTLDITNSKNEYHINEEVSITINPVAPNKIYKYHGNIKDWIFGAIVFFSIGIGLCMFAFKFHTLALQNGGHKEKVGSWWAK